MAVTIVAGQRATVLSLSHRLAPQMERDAGMDRAVQPQQVSPQQRILRLGFFRDPFTLVSVALCIVNHYR